MVNVNLAGNSDPHLYVGYDTSSTGVYNLQGGTLATGDLRVGQQGLGTFNQSGGQTNVSYWLRRGSVCRRLGHLQRLRRC